MTTTYTPEQTRQWTRDDLQQLVGKYVLVTDRERAFGGTCLRVDTHVGAAGALPVLICDGATVSVTGQSVAVCDEHGDHGGPDGKKCRRDLLNRLAAAHHHANGANDPVWPGVPGDVR